MKDIHESASHVVVWLGPASDDSDLAMDTLAQYGKEAAAMGLHQISTEDANNWSGPDATACTKHVEKFVHKMVLKYDLELPAVGVKRIFCWSWFQRVRILQEVSVDRDAVSFSGKSESPFHI
jgi:hypothetical protein